MKHSILILIACTLAFTACRKPKQAAADYGIYGLQTINILNDGFGIGALPLSVKYDGKHSEEHELITLSVSGLPEGITMDPSWQHSGYLPFDTRLMLFDTTCARAYPGEYTLTLTAESSISGRREMSFILIVTNPPVCTGNLTGTYNFCYSYFNGIAYHDEVYNDPRIPNRIWFANFNNSGHKVFADKNCTTDYVEVSLQEIGGVSYSGGGVCKNMNEMSLTVTAKAGSKSTTAVVTMH